MFFRRSVLGLTLVFFSASSYAAKKPVWNRLYVKTATTSSFLKSNWNKYEENYHPNYAFDDNPATAWVEGEPGHGVGASLAWQVSELASVEAVKLRIRAGYQKSKALFLANDRPKRIDVKIGDAKGDDHLVTQLTLKDQEGWQDFVLPIAKGRGLKTVTLSIADYTAGKQYADNCLSDIQVFVQSDIRYNAAVEKQKNQALKDWIKERLATAKYFANLPAAYPFKSTRFKVIASQQSELSLKPHKGAEGPLLEDLNDEVLRKQISVLTSDDFRKGFNEAIALRGEVLAQKVWHRIDMVKRSQLKAPELENGEFKADSLSYFSNHTTLLSWEGEDAKTILQQLSSTDLGVSESQTSVRRDVKNTDQYGANNIDILSNYRLLAKDSANAKQFNVFNFRHNGTFYERSAFDWDSDYTMQYDTNAKLNSVIAVRTEKGGEGPSDSVQYVQVLYDEAGKIKGWDHIAIIREESHEEDVKILYTFLKNTTAAQ